tara:strand:- start:31281 stop:31505 length:225 start_codon:yes stop_codon:yes gene_type:complete
MTREDYKIMRGKIKAKNTIGELWKLEESAKNLYNNGCLDANQYWNIKLGILDVKLGLEEEQNEEYIKKCGEMRV